MTKGRLRRTSPRRPPQRSGERALVWTFRALDDLEAIAAFIAQDKPFAAERWVSELIATAERAAALPLSGRSVPELGRDDVRELIKNTYRLVYRLTEARVEVLTVFEGHRRFPFDATKVPAREIP